MIYRDSKGFEKILSPAGDWLSNAGIWVDTDGNSVDFPEMIATKGGEISFSDCGNDKKLARLALNYALKRRERLVDILHKECQSLRKAIAE